MASTQDLRSVINLFLDVCSTGIIIVLHIINDEILLSGRDDLLQKINLNISKKFKAKTVRANNSSFILIHISKFSDNVSSVVSEIYTDIYSICLLHKSCNTNPRLAIGATLIDDTKKQNIIENLMTSLAYAYGKNKEQFHIYHKDISKQEEERLRKAQYLHQSVLEEKVRFVYQPIMDSKQQISFYEVLVRPTNNNTIDLVEFIEIAESYNFVILLDKLTINHAINKLSGNANLIFSINISNISIQNHHFVSYIRKKLCDNPNIAKRLIIEMTETAQQIDCEQIRYFINIVHDLGSQIALDDFGSGYTSWKQLKDLSIDIVKIDGSFIQDILYNNLSAEFVKSVVNIAKFLKIKVVGEFVENDKIYQLLQKIGVDYFQGYLFSEGVSKL